MNQFYVYEWFIVETEEVFYIGKGKGKRYKSLRRNKFFKDIYNCHNCDVRIIKDNLSEKDAFELEIKMIKDYKQNFPHYRITNQTDGGEGTSGWKAPQSFKIKQSMIQKQLWNNEDYKNKIIAIRNDSEGIYKSKEFRDKMSLICSGVNNPNYGNKWSDEMKMKSRLKMLGRYDGANNPNFGNKWSVEKRKARSEMLKQTGLKNEFHPMAKKVICLETKEIFSCIKYAMEKYPNSTMITYKKIYVNKYHLAEINPDKVYDDKYITNELISYYKKQSRYCIFICIEQNRFIIGKNNLLKELQISNKKYTKLNKFKKPIKINGKTYIDIKNYSPYYQ